MGDAILSQAGCLYGSREWFNGYSFVETDSGDTAIVRLYEFSDQRRKFLPAILNLEFVDKEVKTAHLEHCLTCWETILRGFLSGLKEAIDDLVHDT
ncbi:hypothetical protein ABIF69_007215 [Bradyrhizobium japonicum]